jgi:hypothetical protein
MTDILDLHVHEWTDLRDAIVGASRCIEVLRGLNKSLNFWRGRQSITRPQLDSHDLLEFFFYFNKSTEFERIARETRQEVRDGTKFMCRPDGQVMSTPEACECLDQCPSDRLLIGQVRTTAKPEYSGFDGDGELMEKSGTDRREIFTMTLEEMWEYCRMTGNVIPAANHPNLATIGAVVLA